MSRVRTTGGFALRRATQRLVSPAALLVLLAAAALARPAQSHQAHDDSATMPAEHHGSAALQQLGQPSIWPALREGRTNKPTSETRSSGLRTLLDSAVVDAEEAALSPFMVEPAVSATHRGLMWWHSPHCHNPHSHSAAAACSPGDRGSASGGGGCTQVVGCKSESWSGCAAGFVSSTLRSDDCKDDCNAGNYFGYKGFCSRGPVFIACASEQEDTNGKSGCALRASGLSLQGCDSECASTQSFTSHNDAKLHLPLAGSSAMIVS